LNNAASSLCRFPYPIPPLRTKALKSPLHTISNLQNDLRFVLHLHREGQRAFARKAEGSKKPAQLKPPDIKIVRIKA
jgi:hypothetical protein